ncbi:hypothetical protein, partial [Nocardioides antri]|uniref:hypothetical protein n=1 Tax=Nocardioides antri TaxID=2607659 RepID=UPI001CB6EF28
MPSSGGTVGTPQSDVTTSAPGSPWSPGLPGTETSAPVGPDRAPNEPGGQPALDDPGKGKDKAKGRGDGTGNGHGRGH